MLTDYFNVSDPNFIRQYSGRKLYDQDSQTMYLVGANGLTPITPQNTQTFWKDVVTVGQKQGLLDPNIPEFKTSEAFKYFTPAANAAAKIATTNFGMGPDQVVKSGFDITPGQASQEQINNPANYQTAEPLFNAASAGKSTVGVSNLTLQNLLSDPRVTQDKGVNGVTMAQWLQGNASLLPKLASLGYNVQDLINEAYSQTRYNKSAFSGDMTTVNRAQNQPGGGASGSGAGSSAQDAVDKQYADEAAKNPAIATLAKGGSSLEEIINGLSTGDISGLVDWQGKPFSVEDQQAALAKGMEDNKLYYEALQSKDTADAEAALAKKNADYQDQLISAGQQFQADKTASDQTAADSGVLFSGSRVQKEKNMARAYNQDQATNLRNYSTDIGNTARDFQYKYGNTAATGLNQYYNLGSNSYNSNVAKGGATSNALSSIYNPSTYNYQGTANTERAANANTRAAGYLWNKGNKLIATGYNNQY